MKNKNKNKNKSNLQKSGKLLPVVQSASSGKKISPSSEKPATVLNTSGAVMPSPSSASQRAGLIRDARSSFKK
jgi:hypothetical protein